MLFFHNLIDFQIAIVYIFFRYVAYVRFLSYAFPGVALFLHFSFYGMLSDNVTKIKESILIHFFGGAITMIHL